MTIELEFKDLDEFSEFMCAMNNATAAYQRVINSIILGVDFPSIFDKLAETKTEEELKARLALLVSKYNDLEKIEQHYLDSKIWEKIKEKEIS